jgi:hypothetical protein
MRERFHASGTGRACVRVALILVTIAGAAQAADLAIAIDGPPLEVAARAPGQPVRLVFRAQAGQHVGLGIGALGFVPASATGVGFTVKQPDGTVLPGMEMLHCVAANPQGGCDGEFTIARSGNYVIDVDAPFSAAPHFSIQLSSALARALAVGRSEAVTLTRVGQDGRFPLAIAPGQDVTVELGGIASSSKESGFALRVYRPDGSLLGQASADATRGASVSLGSAAPAGTYIVEVDPDYGATGSFLVAAKAAAQSQEGAIDVSSAAGRDLRFNFVATAGQSVTVGLDNLSHDPDVESNSRVSILKPDGTRLATVGCSTVSHGQRSLCKVSASNLAAATYTIVVSPPFNASLSGKLYRTTDRVAKLDPASPNRVELQTAQVARYTFAASEGDKVGLALTRNLPGDKTLYYVTLLRPDGSIITARVLVPAQAAMQIDPVALPATGVYTVAVDAGFDKGSATLSLIH